MRIYGSFEFDLGDLSINEIRNVIELARDASDEWHRQLKEVRSNTEICALAGPNRVIAIRNVLGCSLLRAKYLHENL